MWAVVRRTLAMFGLFVAVVGFVAFAAAAVGVWRLKAETNRRTDALAVKAHEAVNAADQAVVFVQKVIDQADVDLNRARKPSPTPEAPVNPFLQFTARQASKDLAGSVERANVAVVTASDAALVAQAALEVFGNDSQLQGLKDWLGVKPEQLAKTRTDLKNATNELNQVHSVLGVPVGDVGPTPEQLTMVASALAQARELTSQMGGLVATARTQVDEAKRAVDLWALRIALAVTVVSAIGAAGQFFMGRFCWRVLRGEPA